MASLSETHMMWCMGILSICLFVHTFTFRIYSCSNSMITHAQNLCAKFFSHTFTCCVCTCACRSSTSRGDGLNAFENNNKPVSVPNIVTMCTVGGHLLCFLFGKALSKLQLQFQLYTIARIMDRSDIDQRKEIKRATT